MKLTYFHFLVLFTITTSINAQTYWTRDPAAVPGGQNAKLGNSGNRSLNFVTNNQIRVVADSIGLLRIKGLAGKGYRLVYVDSLGNLAARGGGVGDGNDQYFDICDPDNHQYDQYATNSTDVFKCPSKPCVLNSGPWYEVVTK